MNYLQEKIIKGVTDALPEVKHQIDDGKRWFIDFAFNGRVVVVECGESRGFGVTELTEDTGYGCGPDTQYKYAAAAVTKVVAILRNDVQNSVVNYGIWGSFGWEKFDFGSPFWRVAATVTSIEKEIARLQEDRPQGVFILRAHAAHCARKGDRCCVPGAFEEG